MSEEEKDITEEDCFEVEKPSLELFNKNDVQQQSKLLEKLFIELLGKKEYCLDKITPNTAELTKILFMSTVNTNFELLTGIINDLDINIVVEGIIRKLYQARYIKHRLSQIILINVQKVMDCQKFNGDIIGPIKEYAINNVSCYTFDIKNVKLDVKKCLKSCLNGTCNGIIKQIRQVCTKGEALSKALKDYATLLNAYNKKPNITDNEILKMTEIIFHGVHNDSNYITRALNKPLFNKAKQAITQYLMLRIEKEMNIIGQKKRKKKGKKRKNKPNSCLKSNKNRETLAVNDCINIDNIFTV